jgi:hypothetical protein
LKNLNTFLIGSLLLSFGLFSDGFTQITRLDAKVEAIMFGKVFKYVKTIKPANVNILVVYDKLGEKPNKIIAAFKKEKYQTTSTEKSELKSVISNFNVIYLVPGVNISDEIELFKKNKVLVISGDPGLVSSGTAGIAVASENKKPVIYLNLKSLTATGHDVSFELINLSKVYK